MENRDATRSAGRCDVRQRRLVREANDAEVGAVHHQQRGGLVGDGVLVVRRVGAVHRPHLHQPGAALREHVRYAEASPYLARFAA